jgi:peptidoglycan biosynthesis protein MviN/MurJ (putative lipid II flippase)
LRKKLPRLDFAPLQRVIFPALAAASAAGMVAWVGHRWWEIHLGHGNLTQRLGAVFVPMILATAVYYGLALWLKLPQARELAGLVRSRVKRPPDDPGRN